VGMGKCVEGDLKGIWRGLIILQASRGMEKSRRRQKEMMNEKAKRDDE